MRLLDAIRGKGAPAASAEAHATRMVLAGDVLLSDRAILPEGLVVDGSLTLAPGAHVIGDVQVAGTLVLEPGARIEGRVAVAGSMLLASDARVGPCAVRDEARVHVSASIDGALSCEHMVLIEAREPAPVELLLDEAEAEAGVEAETAGARGG